LTDQPKVAAHHKTLSEHPNPSICSLTDQPKGSCSTQNTEHSNSSIGPLTTNQKHAPRHKILSEYPNPYIGPLTDKPKVSC
jgi:hypothetical protein